MTVFETYTPEWDTTPACEGTGRDVIAWSLVSRFIHSFISATITVTACFQSVVF
mgnify:CR=1 FL=1